MDRRAVMADMMADLQQQCDRILADRCRAVGRHIHDRDALFLRVFVIHDVVARRQNRNQPDIRARIHCRAGDRRFVHDHDLGVADALRDQRGLGIRRAVVDRQLAQRLQFRPAQVAGIFRVAVQYNNFHDILSFSGSTALRANPAGLSVLLFMYFIIVLHPLARESAAFRTAMQDLTVCRFQ